MRNSFLVILFLLPLAVFSQIAKMGPAINRSGSNNYYPTVSGDGRFMLYRSDLAGEGEELWITQMTSSGQWGLQERFDRVIDLPGVNTMGGFNFNIDGTQLVFASRRYGSIGGFDIWIADKSGNNWQKPQNGGMPLNTKGAEGDPSFSPDGKTLYFIRCEGLGLDEAINCSIWTAQRKSNGYFEDPVELPAPINTGHETSPLILADNESLVFASARPGGKGGLDLYMSRKSEDGWSEPIAMDFVNTENDDRYISIPARGDIGYFSRMEGKEKLLYMVKIPEEFRPYKVLYLEARAVNDRRIPQEVTVQYSPVEDKSKFINTESNGLFSLTLKEGQVYDFTIFDREGKFIFRSEHLDLTELDLSKKQREEYVLEEVTNGSIQPLNCLYFEPYSSDLSPDSDKELQRLIFMMQKNPSFNAEIMVTQENYMEDSVKSSPDLTELNVDTVHTTNIIAKIDTIWNTIDFESLLYDPKIDYIMVDSVLKTNSQKADLVIDSLNNVISSAHGTFETNTSYDTVHVTKIKYTYHNDRTQQQAFAVANYLKSKGAPSYRISTKGVRKESATDESGVSVKVRFYK